MRKLISTNPAKNYRVIGSVDISSAKEIKNKVALANKAKEQWKELGVEKRIKLLLPLYEIVTNNLEKLAKLVTQEIGMPIKESRDNINWDLSYLKSFFESGSYLNDEITYKKGTAIHKIIFEPIGTAAVIVPWNFPLGNILWGVIPNLIVGNTVVVKHSEECPLFGKLFAEMMDKLSLPKGVFSEVYGAGDVGECLVKQNIDLVWFTGSSKIGKKLFEIAGNKFVKSILEMGGSNPAIVFDNINIDDIIPRLHFKRFLNDGQVCDAVKRLIVHEDIFKEVVDKFKKHLLTKKVGDPEDPKTDLGSLVAKRQLELLESQVKDATDKGAKVICGGKRPNGLKGAYYLPTILTNIKFDMRVWKEEVFGPVLPIVSFKTEEEAIKLANDTNYGLGAVIFSKDVKRAERVAKNIRAGNIDINSGNHWMPQTPFGGYKDSGMGREHGRIGFQELCQVKVIAK